MKIIELTFTTDHKALRKSLSHHYDYMSVTHPVIGVVFLALGILRLIENGPEGFPNIFILGGLFHLLYKPHQIHSAVKKTIFQTSL